VDLFVRVSNEVAIKMYRELGYIVYRTVLEYYSGDPDEDAYGKCLLHAYESLFTIIFFQQT
jgi:ribosomal protein S18 acetylase RimI-like enzyme